MNCKKCGANLIQGDSFCRSCGASINTLEQFNNLNQNEHVTNVEYSNTQPSNVNYNGQYNNPNQSPMNTNDYYNQQNQYNSQYDADEDLKRAYIGPKYDEFKRNSGTTIVWIFLFGAFYTIYRKMYLLSILWIVGNAILSTFLPGLGTLASFGIKIFIMIKFNELYLKHVNDQVEKIKFENQNSSRSDLINLCTKKGGTNIAAVIIIAILYFVLVICIAALYAVATIGEVKEGVMESSAYGYIDAIEKEIALEKIEDPYYVAPYVIDEVDEDIVKGEAPDEVRIYLDSDGNIKSGTLTYGDVTYEYINGKISEVD